MERLKSKINEKLIVLLEAFKEHDALSISDIMQILDCNRQSAYNYLNRFAEAGYQLQKRTEKRKTYFSLEKTNATETESMTYLPLTGKVLYKYEIIQCLYNSPATITKLREIDIAQSYLYKLLKEMIQDEEIRKVGSTYYLNTEKIPAVLSLSNEDIGNAGTMLSNVPIGHPYYKQLKSINEKINLSLGNIEPKETSLDNYIVYGRKQFQFETIASELKKLDGYDYTHKLLKIDYQTNIGESVSIFFATGMIVYVLEKDTIYLMGKNYSSEYKENIIIRINQISKIEELSEKHEHFNSKEFQEIHKTMFSISVEEPVDVIVEFTNVFNIKKKLIQLCAQRPTAKKLQYIDDKIIYRDTIRGLPDFANYLRRFGRSCHVIEPPALQDMITFSVNRSLERYLQEENHHE